MPLSRTQLTKNIRTRFAPSPTGYLHLGGARTALFNWLYARHRRGEFLLRIEDTDRARSSEEAVEAILQGLSWLGIDYDEEPLFQSQRSLLYRQAVEQLLDKGLAYYCCCSSAALEAMRNSAMQQGKKPRYNGHCRECGYGAGGTPENPSPVVRFKNPEDGEVVVDDLIQGQVRFDNSELDDLILLRSDGSPTYHLTVVVDDQEMAISHVIRGDDHLNNTPRQINLYKALGADAPVFSHIPLIVGANRKPLSKRSGADSLLNYRDRGFLPEAMLNCLVRLGWSHRDQEIFSVTEMTQLFDVAAANKGAAAFDEAKLLWLNQHYLKIVDDARLATLMLDVATREQIAVNTTTKSSLAALANVQKRRSKTVLDLLHQCKWFFSDQITYDAAAAESHLGPDSLERLVLLHEKLEKLAEWQESTIHQCMKTAVLECGIGFGKLAQSVRVAVTGSAVSPAIDATLLLLGKERTLARLTQAISYLRSAHT